MDSKSFLFRSTGIGICHEVNISELGVMSDVLELMLETMFIDVHFNLIVTLKVYLKKIYVCSNLTARCTSAALGSP